MSGIREVISGLAYGKHPLSQTMVQSVFTRAIDAVIFSDAKPTANARSKKTRVVEKIEEENNTDCHSAFPCTTPGSGIYVL